MTHIENERDVDGRLRATRSLIDTGLAANRATSFNTGYTSAFSGPDFEPLDIVAFLLGSAMMLGPLAARYYGFGG